MKIRSITYFCNPKYPLEEKVIREAGEFLAHAKAAYQDAGYEVQTVRLATIPFPELFGQERMGELPGYAQELEKLIGQIDVGYASLGPALPEQPLTYEAIPEAIAGTQNIFFSGVMADTSRGVDMGAVRLCAQVIVKAGPLDPNGFANLRFAALANVRPGAPFFPAAYHRGDEPAFALATEAADLAVDAFTGAASVDEGRSVLVAEVEKHANSLERVAAEIGMGAGSAAAFGGIDFSLAPFPAEAQSFGTAFERLGVPVIGMHGSLMAAAILTEAIERAKFHHTGFSGLMMPLLEDATLAKRAAEGKLTVKDILLYSAVCGTGLDTIPLPGDTSEEEITPLLLDLCALALRLDKPLTARLMPVPGKRAGEATTFEFGFFANSKVMALQAASLTGALASGKGFELRKR